MDGERERERSSRQRHVLPENHDVVTAVKGEDRARRLNVRVSPARARERKKKREFGDGSHQERWGRDRIMASCQKKEEERDR